MKLLDIFLEATNQKFEYGCVMLYFDFPEINKIQDAINPDDIYYETGDRSFGLKTNLTPHYICLHKGVSTDDVKEVLDDFEYGDVLIGNVSLFENPQYDVLKFDVKGKNLHNTNEKLKEFPHTSNFPTYHPHLTIGYLKPGMGKKYVDMFKNITFKLTPKYAVYSKPDGDRDVLDINVG